MKDCPLNIRYGACGRHRDVGIVQVECGALDTGARGELVLAEMGEDTPARIIVPVIFGIKMPRKVG
jgi:hypothetical protein